MSIRLDPHCIHMAFHRGGKRDVNISLMSSIVKIATEKDYRRGKKLGINNVRFAHTELIFPEYIAGSKNSFSSRGTANPSGVHFKNIGYSHPERWVFVRLGWFKRIDDIQRAYFIAKSYVGCPYAYSNVLNTFGFFRTKKDRKGDEDWWCSEIDMRVAGFHNYKVSPNKAYTEVILRNRWESGFYE